MEEEHSPHTTKNNYNKYDNYLNLSSKKNS